MTKIGLLGDTHSRQNVVLKALDIFANRGIEKIVQVGDFGFWPGPSGQTFLTAVNTALGARGQTLYVVPGNHEDYTFLRTLMVREDGWHEAKSHILVAPRGFRWEWDERTFVALGGAPSVDRTWRLATQRRMGLPIWWKEEVVTPEDVEKTVAGGFAEIMVTHDVPFGVTSLEDAIADNPMGFEDADLEYALEGRKLMRTAVDGVTPTMLFHGHYHFKVDDSVGSTKVYGLAADGNKFSHGVLDLETLKFTWN